jgi:nitrite reductase/ring-hydroxylating ferredoxin subunit
MVFAAKLTEVPNFGKKVVTVNGQELLLINVKGVVFACENECPHQGSPLQSGIVKDNYLSCPRHGYRFELASGRCLDHPEFALKVFPVQLQADDILVDLG